jgi:hypothetical protein
MAMIPESPAVHNDLFGEIEYHPGNHPVNFHNSQMNNLGGLGSQYCEHLFDPLKCHSVDTKEDRDIQMNEIYDGQYENHMVLV